MQQVDDLGFCPSFNCYSSDSLAATAAIKVSSQLLDDDHRIHDIGEEDFEFSLALGDDDEERVSAGDTASVFPLFNRDLLVKINEADREGVESNSKVVEEDCSLEKLFINEREPEEESASSSSSSSSEANESEDEARIFCAWRPKMDIGSSSPLSKCKKSSSTGSGSKRWRIRDLLRRSNSEGKEPMVLTLTTPKPKVDQNIPKPKRNYTDDASGKVSGKSKPSIHELLYVQQRAKREGGKRKSYLPYRQGLVGFFSNVNGKGNKFPF